MRITVVLGLCLTLAVFSDADAHGGGVNADGCHTNRKTGDHHCHRGGGGGEGSRSLSSSSSQVRGFKGANSTGRAFRNCAEARAAGAAPVRLGQPGYGRHLDRDGDGKGCE